jgi:hypothetical protein
MYSIKWLPILVCILLSNPILGQNSQNEIIITEANWVYVMTFAEVTDAEDAKPAIALLSSFFGKTPAFDNEEIAINVSSQVQ